MAKKVIEGYIVKQKINKNDEKKTEEIIGMAVNEYAAQELITSNCEYYSCDPFRYESTKVHNGIAFTRIDRNDIIMFTYEKCEVIIEA